MKKWNIEFIVGNLEEKRLYRQQMRRVRALPKDYQYVYRKLLNYGYHFGFCSLSQSDLLDFFEQNAATGRSALEIIGHDAAAFYEELMRTNGSQSAKRKEQFNREILEYFERKGHHYA
jgi:DNA-binding ferritin-like protein (Dps family)